MTDRTAIFDSVAAQIEPFNKKGIALTETTSFAGDLEWDSLTVMDFVAAIEDEFDIIIIDTPPSLGLLSINAMCAANWVLVPVQAEYYALEGFSMLMNSIKMIQRRINRNLKIFGIVMTMVDGRSKLSTYVCDQVNKKMPNKLFNTTVRRLAKVAEAPWSGAPTVILNKPTNSGAGAGSLEYWTLAKEVHRRVLEVRREFGVVEESRLRRERSIR